MAIQIPYRPSVGKGHGYSDLDRLEKKIEDETEDMYLISSSREIRRSKPETRIYIEPSKEDIILTLRGFINKDEIDFRSSSSNQKVKFIDYDGREFRYEAVSDVFATMDTPFNISMKVTNNKYLIYM